MGEGYMSFINTMKDKAKSSIKTIVLPEATDLRVIKATDTILKEGFAKVVLIGNKEEITNLASSNGFNIDSAIIVNPEDSEKFMN